VKHPEEVLGVPFISDDYATKVLPLGVLVACGAPAFVRSPNHFRLAIRTQPGRISAFMETRTYPVDFSPLGFVFV
jgi:hypothetical protein